MSLSVFLLLLETRSQQMPLLPLLSRTLCCMLRRMLCLVLSPWPLLPMLLCPMLPLPVLLLLL
jgi:hypothetical protein